MRRAALVVAFVVLSLTLIGPVPVQGSWITGTEQQSRPEQGSGVPVNTLQELLLTEAVVEEVSSDGSALNVKPIGGTLISLSMPNQLREKAQSLRRGDHIEGSYTTAGGVNALQSFAWTPKRVDGIWRWGSLLGSFLLLLVVGFAATWGKPTKLFLGTDNRYSNSKFQTVVWFWVLFSTYVAINSIRVGNLSWEFVGGVNIPQNLLLLSGISVFTFAAAKGITQSNIEERGKDAKPDALLPKASNLVRDDYNRLDLGDTQMLVITILAVVVYVIQVFNFLGVLEYRKLMSMPDVDTTILAAFGLGQGAYLAKKYVGEAGAAVTPTEAAQAAQQAAEAASKKVENSLKQIIDSSTTKKAATNLAAQAQAFADVAERGNRLAQAALSQSIQLANVAEPGDVAAWREELSKAEAAARKTKAAANNARTLAGEADQKAKAK